MVDAGERRSNQAKPPEKGDGVKGAEKKQRPSRSIEQKFRDLREAKRQVQDEDARRERARAKEAKAAERKKDRESLASAKEFCRELAANWPRSRSKAVVVSEEADLIKLGGARRPLPQRYDKELKPLPLVTAIVFGAEGETRLIFTPYNGAWKIALEGKPSLEDEDLKRELCRFGHGLWDDSKKRPDIAFHAVDALLSCFESFKGLPSDKQQKADVQLAIIATLQALDRDAKTKGRKLQLAFKLLTDDQWPQRIDQLQERTWSLSVEHQRPPYKRELRKSFAPQWQIRASNFAALLRIAGLGWLPKKPK
jgi:hypothetical protein